MTRIYTEDSGLTVNAISLKDGIPVEGHVYDINSLIDPQTLKFQQGTIPEAGSNGATNEGLLAILIHRTEWLDGQFPSTYNKVALEHMRAALKSFEQRTIDRKARQVEGQHTA